MRCVECDLKKRLHKLRLLTSAKFGKISLTISRIVSTSGAVIERTLKSKFCINMFTKSFFFIKNHNTILNSGIYNQRSGRSVCRNKHDGGKVVMSAEKEFETRGSHPSRRKSWLIGLVLKNIFFVADELDLATPRCRKIRRHSVSLVHRPVKCRDRDG